MTREAFGVFVTGPGKYEEHVTGKPIALIDMSPRPWPVDPTKYPLNGSSRGAVYCPLPTRKPRFSVRVLIALVLWLDEPHNPYRDMIVWGGVSFVMWAAIIAAACWLA